MSWDHHDITTQIIYSPLIQEFISCHNKRYQLARVLAHYLIFIDSVLHRENEIDNAPVVGVAGRACFILAIPFLVQYISSLIWNFCNNIKLPLQGANIFAQKGTFEDDVPFPRWDMSVPW